MSDPTIRELLRGALPLSPRKERLLACAACRHLWPLLGIDASRRAVEVAEAFADGRAGSEGLLSADNDAWCVYLGRKSSSTGRERFALYLAGYVADVVAPSFPLLYEEDFCLEAHRNRNAVYPAMFHDLVSPRQEAPQGLPPVVVALARAAYYERLLPAGLLEQDRLSVLADALEEVGVAPHTPLLAHLRSQGPHWRGCWALDLVLGKG